MGPHMIDLKPGIAGVLARCWRMRVLVPQPVLEGPVIEPKVVLECSPDEGMTWLGPFAMCPLTPGATVSWSLTGPLQEPAGGSSTTIVLHGKDEEGKQVQEALQVPSDGRAVTSRTRFTELNEPPRRGELQMMIDVSPWPEAADFEGKTGLKHGVQELSADQLMAIVTAGFDVMVRHSRDGGEPRLSVSPGGRGFGQR